jgi:hypothetical protein
MNRLVYAPGPQDSLGGWFSSLPRIEVRRDGEWAPVEATVEPAYPADYTALEVDEYVFDFDLVLADGVRVIGEPGGHGRYTTVAELEVFFLPADGPRS